MVKQLIMTLIASVIAFGAWAQDGYRIKAGDQLAVEVLEDATLNRSVLVLPDGSISVPLAGSVSAAGRSTTELAGVISSAIAPNFASQPTVFVSVAAVADAVVPTSSFVGSRTIDVYVIGEVGAPGLIEVSSGTTLLQTLAQAGGFTKFAATKRIQLRRTDPQTGTDKSYPFNYRAMEGGASISGATQLADGDVIIVPQRRLFE